MYAIYGGKEYRCSKTSDGKIELISRDHADLNLGFEHSKTNNSVYIKVVSVQETDDVFRINPLAKYKGELFPVSDGGKDNVLLDTTNTSLANKYGFERTDKYMYSKYVDISEVEIIEEKKPYPKELLT